MRQWSDDPIDGLVPSRIGREFLWLCLVVWVLAWLAVLSIDEWLTSRVLKPIRDARHRREGLEPAVLEQLRAKRQRPNPAVRTGTFLHRSTR